MRARRIRDTWKNEKGQSLVEFALVVPLLLLLVIGIAEFGRAWMTKNILTGAAREAVRVAVVTKSTDNWKAVGEARGDNVLASANIPPSTIVTEIIEADGHKSNVATVTHVHSLLFIGNLVRGHSLQYNALHQYDHAKGTRLTMKRGETIG